MNNVIIIYKIYEKNQKLLQKLKKVEVLILK